MCTITLNNELKGIELSFTSKPEKSILTAIKSNGFRWHNVKKVWYAKQSEERLQFANTLKEVETRSETNNKKYQGYVTWITNKSGDYLDTEQILNYEVNDINELLELILLNGFDSYINTIYSINDDGNYHMFNNVTDELTRLLIDLENEKLNALYNN